MSIKNWVSDLPYLHTFDGLEKVYAQIEERPLEILMNKTGYNKIKTLKHLLPDGKKLVRMDSILWGVRMVLLIVDTQKLITNNKLYQFELFE